jgi:pimeloyl-ACP methyl ester carboxylesterase
VLVLLHGLASNMTRWAEFAETTALRDRWDLVRVDLRGHGESVTRRAVTLEGWGDDLVALLDAEGYRRAVLAGHCLGATLAVHCALRAPARTAGVVLVDPVFAEALAGVLRVVRLGTPALRLASRAVRGLNRLGLQRRRLRPMDLRRMDAEVRAQRAGGGPDTLGVRYASPLEDLRTLPTAVYLQDLVELLRPLPSLSRLAVPALALLSARATFGDPDRTRQLLAAAPRCEVAVVAARHWMLTERPDEVRAAIERWCEALPHALTAP